MSLMYPQNFTPLNHLESGRLCDIIYPVTRGLLITFGRKNINSNRINSNLAGAAS